MKSLEHTEVKKLFKFLYKTEETRFCLNEELGAHRNKEIISVFVQNRENTILPK